MRTIQHTHSRNLLGLEAHARPALRASMRRCLAALVLASAVAGALPCTLAQAQPVHIEITHFAGDTVHATVRDGTGKARAMRLHPRDLAGITWTASACDGGRCETVTHRITEVAADTSTSTMPLHGDNGDVWLYRVEYSLASAPGQWHGACQDDAGNAMGIFVNGQWSQDGTWQPGGWTFSCPSGVVSKCVRSWGYKPWKTLHAPAHGDVDLQPLHQACVRAARADYCGDGTSYTRDGTLVDMFDVYGFNVPEYVSGFEEESTFDEHGALSVSFPRWPAGTPTTAGWRLGSCERPRQAAPQRRATALIHVWSDPRKGQADAPATGPGKDRANDRE
jgi:hypothetical protein